MTTTPTSSPSYVGVVPEVDVARRWYKKARELGPAIEAAERLRRLGAPD